VAEGLPYVINLRHCNNLVEHSKRFEECRPIASEGTRLLQEAGFLIEWAWRDTAGCRDALAQLPGHCQLEIYIFGLLPSCHTQDVTDVTTHTPRPALQCILIFEYSGGSMDAYDRQAELIKALAHPVRLQIMDLLRDGEQCVCHIEAVLGLRQAYISQQLMTLRKVELVADRKDGLRVYYHVPDPSVYAVVDAARSVVSRQAQKQGITISFVLKDKARSKTCDCPKCAHEAIPAFAH
jgi:DNA-binding transcriptional ArsR family regulator